MGRVRRVVTAMAAAALAATGMVAVSAGTAQAAGSCTVTGPTRIAIDRPFKEVTYRLASCPRGADASWTLLHSRSGPVNSLMFDGTRAGTMDFYSFMPMGAHTLRPDYAFSADYSDNFSQNRLGVTVKAGGRASLKAARSGSTVTLTGAGAYYAPSRDAFAPRRNTAVRFQTRSCPTCAWRGYPLVRTNTKGVATLKVRAPKAAYWRVVVPGTSSVWEASSSAQRR